MTDVQQYTEDATSIILITTKLQFNYGNNVTVTQSQTNLTQIYNTQIFKQSKLHRSMQNRYL